MKILLTGGAGFIGSNLVAHLLTDPRFEEVRVLDNLSTGNRSNLDAWVSHQRFRFIEGDIREPETCRMACEGMDVICHQAALGSVPRSIRYPADTHAVNVDGFVNMLEAARGFGIQRFVYASSSSVYGDASYSPKVETQLGQPLSPYAVTKLINEQYANVYHRVYGMEVIGLRYFNVFGPHQDPNGPYAAVIPLFFKSALEGKPAIINGDGSITRDFTYIDNVVQMNLLALTTTNPEAFGKAFNVACGYTTTLNELWEMVNEACGANIKPQYGPNRQGDILHSKANIELASKLLGYQPEVDVRKGIQLSEAWYRGKR